MTCGTAELDHRLAIEGDDHALGSPAALVTLVEYADFECLHCGRAVPSLRELVAEHPSDLRLVFRHFPLLADHPHAGDAARAAEAAARQGAFWAMHDMLFENQRHLDRIALELYADELALDVERFRRDVDDPTLAARVARDIESGRRRGARGTPTFFLDGAHFERAWDLDALHDEVGRAVARARTR